MKFLLPTVRFHSKFIKPKIDAHDICIKAKAIARSSGALAALPFALDRLNDRVIRYGPGSQAVLLNTLLSALSREGKTEQFWDVVETRLMRPDSAVRTWTSELTATILNQFALEKTPFQKALAFYRQAQAKPQDSNSLTNSHQNALLKCLSRDASCKELIQLLNEFTGGEIGKALEQEKVLSHYLDPTSNVQNSTISSQIKAKFDCKSVASILYTVARASDGSIQLAETLWSYFSKSITFDEECHLALLLVYRNDIARIQFNQKLIRSSSWRKRKLNRVKQLIKDSGVNLEKSVKFLSVYFEICLNAHLREAISEFCEERGWTRHADERINSCIKRAQIKDTLA